MGGKTYEETVSGQRDQVFAAATRVTSELGYHVVAVQKEAGVISFNTGRSMRSWGGQDMSATVIDLGGGTCRVVLGGSLAKGGMPGSGGTQVVAWGEKGAVASKFFARLREVLPGTPNPASSSSPSPSSDLAAQLADLAKLRDSGVLSEDEFQSAKRRLITG